jgi:hypothetical protein
MPDDDDVGAAVAPLRRQHPYLGSGREVPETLPQVKATLAVRGLPFDVRHHAHQADLARLTHVPMIGAHVPPASGNPAREVPGAGRRLSITM